MSLTSVSRKNCNLDLSDPRAALLQLISFTVIFYATYGLASYLSEYIPWRFSVALPMDRLIPFYPTWAIVYLSMPLMIVLSAIILPYKDFSRLVRVMTIECIAAMAIFLIFPIKSMATLTVHDAYFLKPYQLADCLNLSNNYAPSLHVAFACTSAYFLGKQLYSYLRILVYLWTAAIALSTLFIHAHYIADVLFGLAFAFCLVKIHAWYAC